MMYFPSATYTMMTYTVYMSQHVIDLFPFPGRDPTVITAQLSDCTVATVEPQFTKEIILTPSLILQVNCTIDTHIVTQHIIAIQYCKSLIFSEFSVLDLNDKLKGS